MTDPSRLVTDEQVFQIFGLTPEKAREMAAAYAETLPTSNADKVRLFHSIAGVSFPPRPMLISEKDFTLATNLVQEELEEWIAADRDGDLVEVADALADLLYVVYRAALAYGFPIDRVFEEVHRSNMTKFPNGEVIRRADGKIQKPDSWEPPRIKEILDACGTE